MKKLVFSLFLLMSIFGVRDFASARPPVVPATWTIPLWFFDPQNTSTCAADFNTCTSSTCAAGNVGPCATFAEIIARLGTTQPQYPFGNSVTIKPLSAQSAGVDSIFFEPRISGGGQAIFDARLGWVTAGAAFSAGALSGGNGFAAATRSAGGTVFNIAGMPGYVVTGTLLNNTTRTSYAFVDNAGTGAVQQPQTVTSLTTMTGLPTGVVDNDWVAGDSITPYTLPAINMKRWAPVGSDVSSGGVPSTGWVLGANIVDSSGGAGGSSLYIHNNKCATNVLSVDKIDTRLNISAEGGRGNETIVMGCTVKLGMVIVNGQTSVYGGGLAAGIGGVFGFGSGLNNDVYAHGTITVNGALNLQNVFMDGTLSENSSAFVSASGFVWGSYAVTNNGVFNNATGSTFVLKALLTNGTLKLGALTTGTTPANGGTFTQNGTTEVATSGTFPANAVIALSANTIGSTPCLGAPYFDKAQIANTFYTKGFTALCNDVMNWQAQPTPGVTITPANLDNYGALYNPASGARFTN